MPVKKALAVVDPTLTDRYGAAARTPGRGTRTARRATGVPPRSPKTA